MDNLEVNEVLTELLGDKRILDVIMYKDHDKKIFTVELYVIVGVLKGHPIQVRNASLSEALWEAMEKFKSLSNKDVN